MQALLDPPPREPDWAPPRVLPEQLWATGVLATAADAGPGGGEGAGGAGGGGGAVYYFNSETGESRWDAPPPVALVPVQVQGTCPLDESTAAATKLTRTNGCPLQVQRVVCWLRVTLGGGGGGGGVGGAGGGGQAADLGH